MNQNRFFFLIRRKTKNVLSSGDVNLIEFGHRSGWTVLECIDKINSGHGDRWV